MASLYVMSPSPGEGKTTVALALLQLLGPRGLAGYARVGDAKPHPDATFVKSALGPFRTAEEMTIAADALTGLDGTVVEGDGTVAGIPTLVVVTYRGDKTVDALRTAVPGALGIVLNAVPVAQGRYVQRELRPAIEAAGLRVLGELPEERALRAARVGDLAAFLGGEVIAGRDFLDNEFQSVMIGAMSHQGATTLPYFARMDKKLVVTGGDRIDVHIGALGTPTQAIVMTGGYAPDPVVVDRAEAEGVPIVAVLAETPDTMEQIGRFLRSTRFRHQSKISLTADMVRQNVDLSAIEAALGLTAAGVS